MRDFDDLVGRANPNFDQMGNGYLRYDLIGNGYPRYDLIGQRGYDPRIGATSDAPGLPMPCPPFTAGNGLGGMMMALPLDQAVYQQPIQGAPAVQAIQQPAFGLEARAPRRIQTGYLGFPRVNVKKGECEITAVDAETLLKVTRFIIDSSVAFGLLVEDIKVGRESILLGAGVPAAMFAEDSTIKDIIATETVQEGTTISVALRNVTNADICVSVGATCRYLQY